MPRACESDFGTPPRSADDYKDPRQIGRWVENQFESYGMDLPDERAHDDRRGARWGAAGRREGLVSRLASRLAVRS